MGAGGSVTSSTFMAGDGNGYNTNGALEPQAGTTVRRLRRYQRGDTSGCCCGTES